MLAAHADYVEALLDEVGWEQPVQVVGSSFGAVCGLELAARGRASGVLALAPPWVSGGGAAFYAGLFSSALPGLAIADRYLPQRLRRNRRALTQLLDGPRLQPLLEISDEDAGAMLASFGRFRFFRSGLESARAGTIGPGLPDFDRIEASVTLVWGSRDWIVPAWMRERWQRSLPQARVETLQGFAHTPHLRDPARIAELIQA